MMTNDVLTTYLSISQHSFHHKLRDHLIPSQQLFSLIALQQDACNFLKCRALFLNILLSMFPFTTFYRTKSGATINQMKVLIKNN